MVKTEKRTDTADAGAGTSSVGTTSAALAAANPDRMYFAVTNTHASQKISIAFGATAVAGAGITVAAGATWEMPVNAVYTGAINVIGSGAATTYGYVEW